MVAERNGALRRELTEVVGPLASAISALERGAAAEVAAARGYALTGDTLLLGRLRAWHAGTDAVARRLSGLAPRADAALAERVGVVLRARRAWVGTVEALARGDLSRTAYAAVLPEQQRRYEALLYALARADAAAVAATAARRARIARAERIGAWTTALLALLAFGAAAATLRLGRRLGTATADVARWSREDEALRQIATLLAAHGTAEALDRVADAAREVAGGTGALVEGVDFDRQEIEVLATSGTSVIPVGVRAPYPGSLAEEVIKKRHPEVTDVDTVEREGRPTAALLSEACVRCRLAVVPLFSEGEPMGALVVTRAPDHPPFGGDEVHRLQLLADLSTLGIRQVQHVEALRRSEAALEARVRERTAQARHLASALALAEQGERRALAHVLHDDLQQMLYGVRVVLRRARGKGGAQDAAVDAADALAEEALTLTRRLTVDLSPPVLKGEGLAEALRWLAGHVEERFGLPVLVDAPEGLTVPQPDVRALLFQVVRELLWTAVKHAQATRARVAVAEADGVLRIVVDDDGVGAAGPATEAATPPGEALAWARERLALFDGQLDVGPTPERGTRAVVTFPLAHLHRAGTFAAP